MAEYMVSEARGNVVYENNCIYIPENYPEEWRKRLEAGEVISYEEDGEQCEIWLEMGKNNSSILDPYKRELKEKEKENMKKTIDLLEEAVKMGFSREKALRDIDASLDEELTERKPLMEEEIPDQLYEDILFGFRCEAEEP